MGNETVGERLKDFRKMRGVAQKNLANELGIRSSTLSQWENGVNNVPVTFVWKICKALAITPSMLLGYEEEKNEKPLTSEEKELVDLFKEVSENGKEMILKTARNVKKFESSQVITFMPMLTEGRIPTTELPYYDQAAGMGPGQYVRDAIPDKLIVPSDQVPPKTDFIIRVVGDSMEPTFHSGDRLFIQSTNELEIGDIGVFSLDGEQLVKELGEGVLISHNKKYDSIKCCEDLFVQGKVLGKV